MSFFHSLLSQGGGAYSAYLKKLDELEFDRPDSNTLTELRRFLTSIQSIIPLIDRFKTTLVGPDGDRERVDIIRPETDLATYPNDFDDVELNGWKGDGVDQYVNLKFNPTIGENNYQQNRASAFAYVEEVASGSAGDRIIGFATSTNHVLIRGANTATQKINSSDSFNSAVNMTGTGMKGFVREDAANVSGYNPTKLARTSASVAMHNGEICLLRSNTSYGDSRVSCVLIAGALTEDQVNLFINAYQVFRQGVGLVFALGVTAYGLGQITWGLGQI